VNAVCFKVNYELYEYANWFHTLREQQEMTGQQRNCKNVSIYRTGYDRTHTKQETTGKQTYLRNNALHDFYPSVHSVTSLNEGPTKCSRHGRNKMGVSVTHKCRIYG
jgi:hypothetical protein